MVTKQNCVGQPGKVYLDFFLCKLYRGDQYYCTCCPTEKKTNHLLYCMLNLIKKTRMCAKIRSQFFDKLVSTADIYFTHKLTTTARDEGFNFFPESFLARIVSSY